MATVESFNISHSVRCGVAAVEALKFVTGDSILTVHKEASIKQLKLHFF